MLGKHGTVKISLFIIVFFVSLSFGRDELLNSSFIPFNAVIYSSALSRDGASVLINPANLAKLDRINMLFTSGDSLNLEYFSVASTFSYVGGLALGFYDLRAINKQGLFLGWGKELTGYLAVGLTLKTASTGAFRFDRDFWGDVGLLFYPNATLWDVLDAPAIDNRLYLSLVLQNVGVANDLTIGETMQLRSGIGYDFKEIWTTFFFEKLFLGNNAPFVMGVEITPAPLPLISLRFSYDLQNIRLGMALNGEDFSANFSYIPVSGEFHVSVNAYFEKSRADKASDLVEKGLQSYNEAKILGKQNDDDAFDTYKKARSLFNLALFYDSENTKASYYRNIVDRRLDWYWKNYVKKAISFQKRKKFVTALIYFHKASAIKANPDVDNNIRTLSTNKNVLSYIDAKKKQINKAIRKQDYLKAAKLIHTTLLIAPDEKNILKQDIYVERESRKISHDYFERGQQYYVKRNIDKAVTFLKKAVVYYPDSEEATALLEKAQIQQVSRKKLAAANKAYTTGDYIKAYTLVLRILKVDKNNSRAKRMKGRIEAKLKSKTKSFLDKGIAFYNKGEYARAVKQFDLILIVQPGHRLAKEYRKRAAQKLSAIQKLEAIGD